jgi:hypothetical protein
MSWTKGAFVDTAFEEIGMARYVFDLQPEQLNMALWRLDSMMASWNALGIRLGYPLPTNPNDSSLSEETSVPDAANQAIYQNLAILIAGPVGKAVSAETRSTAKKAYDSLLAKAARDNVREVQMPGTMPAGAGNRWWATPYRPFLNPPRDNTVLPPDESVNFES